LLVRFEPDRNTESDSPNNGEIRHALYSVYGVFDSILAKHRKLVGSKKRDLELWTKIRRGELLKNDPRFEIVRNPPRKSDSRTAEGIAIALNEKDDEWFQGTSFAEFVKIEAAELHRLKDQIEERVAERQLGLQAMFPSRKKIRDA
jgi:hypothetical protein